MMTEKNCKIVGGVSFTVGIIVLLTSSVFLHYVTNFPCPDLSIFNFNKGNEENYKFGSHYSTPSPSRAKRDAEDHLHHVDSCKISTLTFCAGYGVTIALIQIILSGLLLSACKKNARFYSILWCIAHVIVCISIIVIFTVDLSYKEKMSYSESKYYKNSREIAFLVITALDFILLSLFVGSVSFFLIRKSDYQDYSLDDTPAPDQPIVFRAQ